MKKLFNIRTKYILFITLIHVILLLVSIPLLETNKWYFTGVELFILVSVILSIHLYNSLIRPLNLISDGIEAIKIKDFNTKFVNVGQLEMDNLIDVYNQMIETLRLRQVSMEKQNYFLEQLINASPSGIIILNLDNKIKSLNPRAQQIIGITKQQVGNTAISKIENIFLNQINKLEPGESTTIKLDGLKAYKCQKSHFFNRGFPHHFIIIEELTKEIFKSEKNAYERIIRMMSHEINNSVGAINSILNSVLEFTSGLENEEKEDYENALKVAVKRNERLNKFMANFADLARLPKPKLKKQNLHEILKSIQTLMASNSNKNITWTMNFTDKSFDILVDVQQMEMVILNILKNAIEAVKNNGTIEIITQNAPIRKLIIRDNGCGINQENKTKIFTPFFSTKNKGQGIGLTLTRDILMNHDLIFSLESKNGFTEFCIKFPD